MRIFHAFGDCCDSGVKYHDVYFNAGIDKVNLPVSHVYCHLYSNINRRLHRRAQYVVSSAHDPLTVRDVSQFSFKISYTVNHNFPGFLERNFRPRMAVQRRIL